MGNEASSYLLRSYYGSGGPNVGVSGRSDQQARARLGLIEVFVGVIVVGIIGNAAEHSSAVLMARRTR